MTCFSDGAHIIACWTCRPWRTELEGNVGWAIEAKEAIQAKGQLAPSFDSFDSPSPAEELEPPK